MIDRFLRYFVERHMLVHILTLIVVIGGVKTKFPRAPTVWERRVGRGHVPASECPGANFYVIFGIIEAFVHTDAQRKQLQQFPSVVFVYSSRVVHLLVEPPQHCRVVRNLMQ